MTKRSLGGVHDIVFSEEEHAILDVLMSSPGDDSSSDKPSAYRRQVNRQKEELKYLKTKISEMQLQLAALTLHKEIDDAIAPPSHWKELAQNERKRQFEAQQENRKLKEAVEEQMQFAQSLINLIRKKPRLCVFPMDPNDQWKELKLVADPAARFTAFHAIADREYTNLSSAFIMAGLVDCTKSPQKHEPRMCNNTLEIHTSFAVHVPRFSTAELDYKILTESIYDVMRGAANITERQAKRELLTEIDDNVSYTNMSRVYPKGKWLRRIVCKRYYESNPKRCVIVTRSIKSDDLLPIDPSYSISSELSWFTIDYVPNGDFVLKYVHKIQPFATTDPISSTLVSEYVMELNAAFASAFEFCAAETQRRFKEYQEKANVDQAQQLQ